MTNTTASPPPKRLVAGVALAVLSVVAAILAISIDRAQAQLDGANQLVFYDDTIGAGFDNWSWAENDVAQTTTVASGEAAASFRPGPWEALYFGRTDPVAVPFDGTLDFSVHGGVDPSPISVALINAALQPVAGVEIQPTAGNWTTHSIDLSDLGSPAEVTGVWFQENAGRTPSTMFVDEIVIVGAESGPAATGPTLAVRTGASSITRVVTNPATDESHEHTIDFPRPISERIYGMNFATDAVREELSLPVNRWGGNSTERFNHEVSSSNTGNDWFFMNAPDDDPGGDHRFENDNQADGTQTIMTLPMMGWVAADRTARCGYPQSVEPNQDAFEPHYLDTSLVCGNGWRNGEQLPAGDPTLTSRAVDEAFAADWVRQLVAQHGTAATGGVEMYALGNEPGLWHSTHNDVRPQPIGRDEIVERNATWANAVKAVDPSAEILAPVLWSGYSYYVTSEEMLVNDQRPGDVPVFYEDYLARMADASTAAGERLLDHFTIHFYDDRVYGGGTDALRLEATRNLWDPTYAPSDWWVIRDFTGGEGSAVVPRMRNAIDRNYPGTGLAITEYNFGGEDTIAGGLAQADALGIFAREGVDIATAWDPWADWVGISQQEWADRPFIDAFRLYRNYDGAGSRFGDTVLHATSTDEPAVSIHAARRSSDGAVTLIVLNKTTAPVVSDLTVEGIGSTTAAAWRWSAATGGTIEPVGGGLAVGGPIELPARSATVLVIGDTPIPATPTTIVPAPPATPNEPTPAVRPPRPTRGAALIDPPSTAAEGVLDSRSTTWVWMETGPTRLESDAVLEISEPGSRRGSQRSIGVIPAGTTVCAWYVHADKLEDRGRMVGRLAFRQEVLGLQTHRTSLSASAQLNHPDTEPNHGKLERSDRLRWSEENGRHFVWWNIRAGNQTDGFRVITAC